MDYGILSKVQYAMARHIGEGFGLIRGLSDLGLKGDYLFLEKDPDDDSLGVLQTAGGSAGFLIELALPLTFGVAGVLTRGAKYSRAIKQAKAAGLYTPEVGKAAKTAFIDETVNAAMGSVANIPRILAAPIDGAGKMLLGKDMQLGKKIVEASGANIPVKDVRNVMVAEYSTNPVNRGIAQRHVALVSESVRTGAKGAEEVKAVAARQGLNWETHIDELKSLGLDYDKATDLDKAIKGWGKEIIDVERIAATRAIQLGDAAPAGVKAFLTGKDSPFAALINSARRGAAARAVRTNSEADKIRAESFLMQTGSKKIAEAMKEGRWDTGRIERVNATMFASREAKEAAISKVKEGVVGKVQGRLGAEDSISLSAEEADNLLDYFVFNFTGAPRSRVGVKATIEEMPHMASTKQVLQNIVDGKNNVSVQDILSLRADATTIELAGRGTTVKSVDEAIAGLGGQGAIEKALSPFRALKGGGYQKQAYIDLFKPEELRRGVIRKYFSMYTNLLPEIIKPQSWRGSAVEEVGSYVRGRFAAAQEEFKSNIRKTKTQVNPATGVKYTHEEAASKVVFDEWTKGEVLNETRAHESIFTDFVSGMFGGIEAITDAIQTSKGEAVLDSSALDPKSIMALVEGLAETIPELKEFRSAFVQLMRMGRPDQAKMALQATALFFEGKPISSIITKEAFLSRLNASGRNVVEESLMSVDQLEKAFGRMAHVETVYAAKEADSVLFFTWANKRTGNILDEAFRMLKDRKGYLPNETTALLKAEIDLPFRNHVLFGDPERVAAAEARAAAGSRAAAESRAAEEATARQRGTPWAQTKEEFESTSTPLMHGTNEQFDVFSSANAKDRYGRPARRDAHYFTEQRWVAETMAESGSGRQVSFDEWRRINEMDFESDDVTELLELFYKSLDAQIAKGRRLVYEQADPGLPRYGEKIEVKSAREIPKDDLEEGNVWLYHKEPRIIEENIPGRTLDFINPENLPDNLPSSLRDKYVGAWGTYIWSAHEKDAQLLKWARENNYGKIKLPDSHESGDVSFLVLEEYIGLGRDPHKEFVRRALEEGRPVPESVLRQYPDLRPPAPPPAPPAPPAARSTTPPPGWMKHHLELTRRSVLKGAAEEIGASAEIGKANQQWNSAAESAAKAWVDSGYAGSVADAIKEIKAAYITHHKTPWKDWQKITQGEKRQDSTQLFDEQLSWMLDDMYKAATRDSEGIVRRTRGGVESIMDLPLIFSETAALKTDLMDAINLTRTSELMAETRRPGGKSVVMWEGKETSPGWISGEIGKRTDQIKATDASTPEGRRLVEELRREAAALRAALPPSPRLNIGDIQSLPPAARPLAFLAHATEKLVEASDAFKNSGHAAGLQRTMIGLAHEGTRCATSALGKARKAGCVRRICCPHHQVPYGKLCDRPSHCICYSGW